MALTIYNGELTSYDVSTKEVSGEHVQSLQIDLGGSGEVSPLTKGQKTAAESVPVILASDQDLPLPSGAAVATKQDETIAAIESVEAKLPTLNAGNVPISAAALPLPSGAATSDNQTSLNSKVDSVNAKLPALSGGRVPVDVGSPSVAVSVRSFSSVSQSSYSCGTTTGQAVAENASRKGGFIQNVSDVDIYLLFAASGNPTTASVKLRAGSSIDFSMGEKGGVYTGAVRAINFVGSGKNLAIIQTT